MNILTYPASSKSIQPFIITFSYSAIILYIKCLIFFSVTYPFDLTKTRLQIQSEVATAKQGYKVSIDLLIQFIYSIECQGLEKEFISCK